MRISGYYDATIDLTIPFDDEPRSIAGFYFNDALEGVSRYYGCVLNNFGVIACESDGFDDPISFPNPPYNRMDQDNWALCAQRATDLVIECNDGSEHDFGEVVDVVIEEYPYLDATGELHRTPSFSLTGGDSGLDFEISICAITTNNRIRCEGPYYDPEVLDALDALP